MSKGTLREWNARLETVAVLESIEDAPLLPEVRSFWDSMPERAPFATQDEAIEWLRHLKGAGEDRTQSAELQMLLRGFARRERGASITDVFKEPDLTAPVWIDFDLMEGEHLSLEEMNLSEDGYPLGPVGPFSSIFAPPFGMLGEAFQMGYFLANHFGWTPVSARSWLICREKLPEVPAMTSHGVSMSGSWEARLPDGTFESRPFRRFRFEVDLSVPPRHAAEFLRAELTELRGQGQSIRPIKEETAAIVQLAARMNDGINSWSDVRDAWNLLSPTGWRRFPKDEDGLRDFTNTARKAYKRLRHKPFPWKAIKSSLHSNKPGGVR